MAELEKKRLYLFALSAEVKNANISHLLFIKTDFVFVFENLGDFVQLSIRAGSMQTVVILTMRERSWFDCFAQRAKHEFGSVLL